MTCAGKTFTGDYLATRGWHHIDGDYGNQSTDPKVKEMWANILKALTGLMGGETVDENLWKPYFETLVEKFKEGMKTGKNVVLSFAFLNIWGERDWIKEKIAGVKFAVIEADHDVIV